jgi:hypothetical protein
MKANTMKSRKTLILELVVFLCCMITVLVTVTTFSDQLSTPNLIGLIAGSFGAGATLTNLIRDYLVFKKNSEV